VKYFQFLNKYIEKETFVLLKKDLRGMISSANLIPWTPENLVYAAKASNVAVIPIDLSVPMQRLKPENRLLIMWRLGLPCLTSPSPAYERVSRKAGVTAISNTPAEWFQNLSRLLNEPNFASDEILKAQNFLRENHNESILLRKWDAAIESVTG
jgi:hypothetical protein